jgi:glutamine amidotransferase-like uncharacterized protein
MMLPRRLFATALLALALIPFGACRGHGSKLTKDVPILLFNGTGTSPNDVAALETVLERQGLSYSRVNSSQLNAMGAEDLRGHRLLIVPGGNFEEMGNHLTANAAANIRNAVQGGMNYLGVCAGAFMAGNSPYNGFNLTSGVRFAFYSAESHGIRKTALPIADAGGSTLNQYWEDGPQLSGWGAVIAKYPDGTPAVVQGNVGKGWVILTGIHPEAPENWRHGMSFSTPADVDNAYAARLIQAALNRTSLPHY